MTQADAQRMYMAENYRRSLRRTANGLGLLMIAFLAVNLIISIILIIISSASGSDDILTEGSVLEMLTNGLISSVTFFLVGLIYCLITRHDFARLFPFEKIGGSMLAKLCVIGLSLNLFSNLVVDLVNNTFGLFGIENNGGTFDFGSEPDVMMVILTVAVIPAFVEEFAFRGVVMGVLRPYSEGLAIIVSSALFALMHGNFVQMPFTFCCGLVFAYMDIKTNSLMPSIIVHFLNNGLSVLADIFMGYNIMDEIGVNLFYGAIIMITGILSFIFLKDMVKDKDFFTLDKGDEIIPYKRKMTAVASSPPMICFAVLMVGLSIATLFTE